MNQNDRWNAHPFFLVPARLLRRVFSFLDPGKDPLPRRVFFVSQPVFSPSIGLFRLFFHLFQGEEVTLKREDPPYARKFPPPRSPLQFSVPRGPHKVRVRLGPQTLYYPLFPPSALSEC